MSIPFLFKKFGEYKSSNYLALDYIESTGTQYIDTGISPSNNLQIQMKIQVNELPQSKGLHGIHHGSPTWKSLIYTNNNNSIGIYFAGTMLYSFPINLDLQNIIEIDIKNTDKFVQTTLNGNTQSRTYTSTNAEQNYPEYLFHVHSDLSYARLPQMKLYYYRRYENGELVRDMTPVLWKALSPYTDGNTGTKISPRNSKPRFI